MPQGQYSLSDAQPVAGTGAYRLSDAQPVSEPEKPSIAEDFAKYSPVGLVKGLADAIRDPKHALASVLSAPQENAKLLDKAKDSYQKGDYTGAAAHFLNYLMPGGSGFEDAGQDFAKGEYAHGAAKTAGMATTMVAGAKAPQILEATGKVADAAPRVATAVKEGVKAAGPDVVAGGAKVAAGEVLAKLPGMEFPARLGLGYPGAKQMGKGLSKGFDAAKASLSQKVAAVSQAAQAEAESLNGLAEAQTGKAFVELPHDAQESIRGIAKMAQQAESAPAPANAMAPEAAQQIFGDMSSPQGGSPQPAPAAPVAVPASKLSIAEQLRDEMLKNGTIGPENVGTPHPAPEVPKAVFEAAARTDKATKLANAIHKGGISYQEATLLTPDDFSSLAKSVGVNVPSQKSIGEALFRLQRLEAGKQ